MVIISDDVDVVEERAFSGFIALQCRFLRGYDVRCWSVQRKYCIPRIFAQ